jgi:metal-dependent amidase/aminoacylase/carboxypeptidase family protein
VQRHGCHGEVFGIVCLPSESRLQVHLRVVGSGKLLEGKARTASEDFSYFAQQIPGFFFFAGISPPTMLASLAAPNHSPRFQIDEEGLPIGLRATINVTFDYLSGTAK